MTVFHRWLEAPSALYDEIQSYFQHGVNLKEGDCVFDVGANIGVFSLVALEHVGDSGSVFAFEPIPGTYNVLRRNAQRQGEVIRAFNVGMGDEVRDATFHAFHLAPPLSSMYAQGNQEFRAHAKQMLLNKIYRSDSPEATHRKSLDEWLARLPKPLLSTVLSVVLRVLLRSKKTVCRLTTISQVIRQFHIDEISLLKIDVEWAELDVLSGIDDQHWPRIRQIAMEVHNTQDRIYAIAKLLVQYGFDRVCVSQDEAMRGSEFFCLTALRA